MVILKPWLEMIRAFLMSYDTLGAPFGMRWFHYYYRRLREANKTSFS
jgi:hypothetical protein